MSMAGFQDKRSHTLWMGDLEPEMDETFVATAFLLIHEPIVAVRIIKNRLTGDPAGYCFVEFADEESAQRALLRLNGKPIPGNLHPPRRFKLNPSVKPEPGEEFSIFVGDLTDDVDDYDLYKTFKDRYPSTKGAKVVLESNGDSRGFGFVRFGHQHEQLSALKEMQFHVGLGGRPLRVSSAMPKRPSPGNPPITVNLPPPAPNHSPMPPPSLRHPSPTPPQDPRVDVGWQQWAQYYSQWTQWAQWAQWAQWNQDMAATPKSDLVLNGLDPVQQEGQPPQLHLPLNGVTTASGANEEEDPMAFDVEASNRSKMSASRDLEAAMHEAQWFDDLFRYPV